MERPFPAYRGDDPYTFVCYSHTDADLVYPELVWLTKQNCNIWYDEGIAPGQEWTEELAQAIKGASHFLYFVSPDSIQSRNCRDEVNFALENDQHLVSVHLTETQLTDGLRLSIGLTQAILKHELEESNYQEKLLTALKPESQDATFESSLPIETSIAVPLVIQEPKTTGWKKAARIGLGLVAAVILAVGLFVYSVYEDATTTFSVAVLPFANMSSDEEAGFFARGLSENILDKLAQRVRDRGYPLGKLKVASRTGSFQFADKGEDLSVIAETLNVAYVLEGSVQRIGDGLHITTQLIRAEDNFHVWSKSYERDFAGGFKVQGGVAQNIAHIAESELLHDIEKRFAFWGALANGTSTEAYGHLLNSQNQSRLIGLGEGGDWALRVQLLKKAIEADPDFGYAYEMLANAYMSGGWGSMSRQEASAEAHAAISRAIELNPDSVDSFLQLGEIYLYLDLDYANAKASFEPGLDRFPDQPAFYKGLAKIALREGRTSEALRQMATASVLHAGEERASFLNTYGWVLLVAGDYEQSLKVYTEGLNLMPVGRGRLPNLRGQIAALINLGRVEEAKPLLAEAWDLDGRLRPEAYISALVRIGEKERAERILADSQSAAHYSIARGYLALGDIDNTFKAIEAGIENQHYLMIESLRTAEWWHQIRDDPRFDDMLRLLDSKETHTERYLQDHSL